MSAWSAIAGGVGAAVGTIVKVASVAARDAEKPNAGVLRLTRKLGRLHLRLVDLNEKIERTTFEGRKRRLKRRELRVRSRIIKAAEYRDELDRLAGIKRIDPPWLAAVREGRREI